jgi:hypothetical protein
VERESRDNVDIKGEGWVEAVDVDVEGVSVGGEAATVVE